MLHPADKLAELAARCRAVAKVAVRFDEEQELRRIAEELMFLRRALLGPGKRTHDTEVAWLPQRSNVTTRAKNPVPGLRRCSNCREVKPVSAFAFSDRKKGKLRADCRACYNGGQRDRYVRAGYKIVTIEVLDTDPCVGHPCPVCAQPFEAGQRIQADHLRHEHCGDPSLGVEALASVTVGSGTAGS
jgi:hypothetical protein